jgi:hypothetical protein
LLDLVAAHFYEESGVSSKPYTVVYGWSLDAVTTSTAGAVTSSAQILFHQFILGLISHFGVDGMRSAPSVLPRLFLLTESVAPVPSHLSNPVDHLFTIRRNNKLPAAGAEVLLGAPPTVQAVHITLAQAPLWGYLGGVGVEFPAFRPTVVDLPSQRTPQDIALLCAEIRASDYRVENLDSYEDRVAFRNGHRFVARLEKGRVFGSELKGEESKFDANKDVFSTTVDGSRSSGAYVITGGYGGFGRRLTAFLAASGLFLFLIMLFVFFFLPLLKGLPRLYFLISPFLLHPVLHLLQ